jgi:hypothetical protein
LSLQTVYDECHLKKSKKAPKEFIRCWTERDWELAKRTLNAQAEGSIYLVTRKVEIHKKDPETLKNRIEKVEQTVLYYDG